MLGVEQSRLSDADSRGAAVDTCNDTATASNASRSTASNASRSLDSNASTFQESEVWAGCGGNLSSSSAIVAVTELLSSQYKGQEYIGAWEGENGVVVYGCRVCQLFAPTPQTLRHHVFTKQHMYMVFWMTTAVVSVDGVRNARFPSEHNFR